MKATESFWKPTKKVKLAQLNVSKYPKRTAKEWRVIDKKPYGDNDRDKVMNYFDCRPLVQKQQGWAHKGISENRERSTHVVMMKPEKFLRTTYRETANKAKVKLDKSGEPVKGQIFEMQLKSYKTYSKPGSGWHDPENVEQIKKALQSPSERVPIPFLEYDEQGRPTGHEGRHRAMAAKQLGIKLIPVTIGRRLKQPRDWAKMRKSWGYKKTKQDWRNDLENVEEVISSKSADIPVEEQMTYGQERPEGLQILPEIPQQKLTWAQRNPERVKAIYAEWKKRNPERVNAASKKWREQNPEKFKEANKAWVKRNLERVKAKNKEWREKNFEIVKARSKAWYEKNIEKVKATSKEWREKNAERIKEWKEKNAERIKEVKKAWAERNPEKLKAASKAWKERNPDWYERNRERILAIRREEYKKNPEKILAATRAWYNRNREKISATRSGEYKKNNWYDKFKEDKKEYTKYAFDAISKKLALEYLNNSEQDKKQIEQQAREEAIANNIEKQKARELQTEDIKFKRDIKEITRQEQMDKAERQTREAKEAWVKLSEGEKMEVGKRIATEAELPEYMHTRFAKEIISSFDKETK